MICSIKDSDNDILWLSLKTSRFITKVIKCNRLSHTTHMNRWLLTKCITARRFLLKKIIRQPQHFPYTDICTQICVVSRCNNSTKKSNRRIITYFQSTFSHPAWQAKIANFNPFSHMLFCFYKKSWCRAQSIYSLISIE